MRSSTRLVLACHGHRLVILMLAWAVSIATGMTFSPLNADDKITFNQHIRPILADKCFACHGRDASQRQADLRLDSFASATSDDSGTQAIVPGKPDESPVYTRSVPHDGQRPEMPEKGEPLTEIEAAALRSWSFSLIRAR